jgi:hypothetical protein
MPLLSLLISLLPYVSSSQYIPSYAESSNGLGTPELEGGRTELELADINGDGNVDILSIGDHGSPFVGTQEHGVMVWFGDGTGNWTPFQFGNFGYGGIAVGDVNNDGFLDVGYAMHHNYSGTDLGDQLIEVALGNGTGMSWSAWDNGLASNGESWGMFCTDFADIDGDGDLDIASNSFGASSGIHVYANQGDGSWVQAFGFIGGNSTDDIVFGDVNNDGFPDFAAAHQHGTVYLNDGTGSFTQSDGDLPPGGLLGREGPDLGDVDNDGTDELSYANSSGGVQVWKWGDGNVWTLMANGLPSSGSYESTQLADLNRDGFADLAAFGNGVITVWLGDGAGTWTQATQFTLPASGDFQAFRVEGDADRNGYPDIALVDEEGSGFSYQNHLRFYRESSPADQLSIGPVFPGPNRTLNVLSVQTIRWVSEVPPGDSSWVDLDISLNDTTGPWLDVVSGIPNNGHHQWSIPESMGSPNPCRMRYTVHTATGSTSAISPFPFYIPGNGTSQIPCDSIDVFQARCIPPGTIRARVVLFNSTGYAGQQVVLRVDGVDYPLTLETNGVHTRALIQLTDQPSGEHTVSLHDPPGCYGDIVVSCSELTDAGEDWSWGEEFREDGLRTLPGLLTLQNHPDPFNPATTIVFTVPAPGHVTLAIYDVLGREIVTLLDDWRNEGSHSLVWDGRDSHGVPAAGGVYFSRIALGSRETQVSRAKRMMLLK